ncbi:MAG: hypothetical protein A2Z99_16345 [Treponema sp. GWB1_62_6]|nr:MAG: hypothetical protein A2Z99_16345 [Treponema sp. GWB1_62_6]
MVIRSVDFKSPYLSRSLIAYIGNKRTLLPFIGRELERCAEFSGDRPGGRAALRLLDPFAGSGGVSRLGRALGFRVLSNDLEYYATLIARCRIVLDPGRLERAFAAEGGSEAAFAAVDAFAASAPAEEAAARLPGGRARDAWFAAFAAAEGKDAYLAAHYAPKRTEGADWKSERLFYTAENARWLDRARESVELRYPFDPLNPPDPPALKDPADTLNPRAAEADAKAALVDALLYEAATRTNTSGVFKACHRGFGGHGSDALQRIMAPMNLKRPFLIEGEEAEAGNGDAASFCASRSADIAYLDPPYNQHQYGSNYHLLTTVARWDKPPVDGEADPDGRLLNRAGIRADWTETRSDFCRRGKALDAFSRLLDAVDARFVLLSYSDGGIVPLEALADLLSKSGALRIEANPYVAYRGGKQSASRLQSTSEMLFVLERTERPKRRSSAEARVRLRNLSGLGRLRSLLRGRFDPRRLSTAFADPVGLPVPLVAPDGRFLRWRDWTDGEEFVAPDIDTLETGRLDELDRRLRTAACASASESFDLVIAALEAEIEKAFGATAAGRVGPGGLSGRNGFPVRSFRDAVFFLGKLAFKKYADDYRNRAARLRTLVEAVPPEIAVPASLRGVLDNLDARAALRGIVREAAAATPATAAPANVALATTAPATAAPATPAPAISVPRTPSR